MFQEERTAGTKTLRPFSILKLPFCLKASALFFPSFAFKTLSTLKSNLRFYILHNNVSLNLLILSPLPSPLIR